MNNNKVFVVTGGASGIGREIVLSLLERKYTVIALDISEKGLNETHLLVKEKQENLKTYVVDITDLLQVESVYRQILEKFDKVTGLIHVAGVIQPFVKVIDLDYKAIEKVININLYGTIYLNKTFLPILLKQPEAYLVNVSSMGGFLPVPGQAIYGATKSAVKLLSEALYTELKGTSVNVSVVLPGGVNTNISKNSNVDMMQTPENTKYKMLTASKVADIIIKAMFKKKLYIYAGPDAKLMKHLTRVAPKATANMIAKKMGDLIK